MRGKDGPVRGSRPGGRRRRGLQPQLRPDPGFPRRQKPPASEPLRERGRPRPRGRRAPPRIRGRRSHNNHSHSHNRSSRNHHNNHNSRGTPGLSSLLRNTSLHPATTGRRPGILPLSRPRATGTRWATLPERSPFPARSTCPECRYTRLRHFLSRPARCLPCRPARRRLSGGPPVRGRRQACLHLVT